MDIQKAQLIAEFIDDCRVRNFSKESIIAYRSHLRYFLSMNPINASLQDLSNFLVLIRDTKGLRPSTVGNYFVSLSTFYEYLVFKGALKENLIPAFRKRYVRYYKNPRHEERQLITYEQMRDLILYPKDIMWRTIFLMYCKTGVRRQELIDLDENDIDLKERKIHLKKHHPKRSNCILFIDDELFIFLVQWLEKRSSENMCAGNWLFNGLKGKRIYEDLIYETTTQYAQILGFHNPNGHLDEKFTPHCFRHYFTTRMLDAGCPREYVQELRGDVRKEAIDIYHHIPISKLKEVYFSYIFKFGIK
jgi:integrase/recombinase XerD